MKTRNLWAAFTFCCLFLIPTLEAQVTSVNYQIKYNDTICGYDAYIIINAGSAISQSHRVQGSSQFSLVLPATDSIQIVDRYMPLQGNAAYDGTVPAQWDVTSELVAPPAAPGSRFVSITPGLNPTSRYNNLAGGDTVRVFSFTVSSITKCGEDIRIYNNGVDPPSGPDMAFLDFSNGFTIGSLLQRYNANSVQLNPPLPVLVEALTNCNNGIEIDLTATTTACQTPLTYLWTGPNAYSSTSQDVSIIPSTSVHEGTYKVVVTDSLGCKDSLEIMATNKPNAGIDQTVCAGVVANLAGTSPTSGTWTAVFGNPLGATLNLGASGTATVSFAASANGTYSYVYAHLACTDTMSIFVNPRPTVSITGSNAICIGASTTLSPNTGGTWMSNNESVATVDPNTGVVTAVGQGSTTFVFTNSATGCQATTGAVTVNAPPTVTISGFEEVCILSTTTVTPSSGGNWVSHDPTIASIENNGIVTGIAAGQARFVFTNTNTGCISDTLRIDVRPKPTITEGADSICVFTTTQLEPMTGGTWSITDNTIASISNAGEVTGLTPGVVTATWTQTSTGCSSDPSGPIEVLARPSVSLSNTVTCVGVSVNATPNTGGSWISNNIERATIDASTGVITPVSQGIVTFTFTSSLTTCANTTVPLTINPSPTVLAASNNICIGAQTTLTPATGGVWTSLHPDTATVANVSGVIRVTGVGPGNATMRFVENGTGCVSTLVINVTPRPTITNGDPSICIGETTQLQPSTGGTWTTSSFAVANISNTGQVTGVGTGTAFFTFTSSLTGCTSLPSNNVTVVEKPTVSITGANLVCIGLTTTLSPTTGGTWISTAPGVAEVSDAGVVTAISAGTATFIFTATGGCASNPTAPVTVSNRPSVGFTGPNPICEGTTTTVSPTTGGTWISVNPAIAAITNAGLVTGILEGTTQLIFTETSTTCVSLPLNITIQPKPTSTLDGPGEICINANTNLLPATGGTWFSNANNIATITNDGLVTGVAQGTAIFTFTSTAGCVSDPITSIAVMPNPTVSISGPDEICINTSTQLIPASGGSWVSSDTNIATVTAEGVVSGVAEGLATFVFTSAAGCASNNTDVITINPKPIVLVNGPSSICVGANTNLTPSVGGTWTSVHDTVATIINNGTVTGVSPGTVRFIYTNTASGCISDTSTVVTVTPGPDADLGVDTTLCIGETTTLSPTTGGTWTSSHPTIASINNDGLVTAIAQGQATFRFRLTSTGCLSEATDPITVNGKPAVSVLGPNAICAGGTTTLSPSTGGTWASNHPSIAEVTATGLVTGLSTGAATFTFTATNGCPSDATEPINVTPAPIATITGDDVICVGGTTTLSPSSGGTWASSNNSIATVTNTGIVTGLGTGKVTFTFVETVSGCAASAPTDTLTIQQCFNPDFNATFVNILVPGNVSTNDNVTPGTVYGSNPVLRSSPAGSIPVINMNPSGDGSYTFTANLPGVYVYNVQVCVPPLASGCPTSELTITVANHLLPTPRPFAHVDFATTPINTEVTLKTLANDGCAVVTGCDLDEESVTIVVNPLYGIATVNGLNGDITYDPNPGFVGVDTLTYSVCVTAGNCATAKQVITVNSPTSLNNTVAADDFAVTAEFTVVTGNVKTNDSDPQGDVQTITPISTSVPAGSLELLTDGTFTFTPADNFTGPVEFVYQTIDNNSSPDTAYATLHILVVPDLRIRVRTYLEGALMNNANQTADGRPLMRDNLRVSPFNSQNYIPATDPYRQATTYINFVSKFTKVAPGDRSEFLSIADPTTVFGVTGQNAIVDWVFVELRSKTSPTTVLATRSGLLQRDGDVVDIDGINGLRFPGIVMDDYYVVVRHLRHLGIMTRDPQTPQQLTTLVNFTTAALPVYDKGTVSGRNYTGLAMTSAVKVGYRAMWGGDFDASGKIKYDNPNDDLNVLYFNVFTYPNNPTGNVNFDFAYGYLPGDFDMNSKAKFDNPNDDKNMLFLQVLFYALNASLLSNYDFFIEQLP